MPRGGGKSKSQNILRSILRPKLVVPGLADCEKSDGVNCLGTGLPVAAYWQPGPRMLAGSQQGDVNMMGVSHHSHLQ